MQPRRNNGKKQMRAGKTRQGRLKTATKSGGKNHGMGEERQDRRNERSKEKEYARQ